MVYFESEPVDARRQVGLVRLASWPRGGGDAGHFARCTGLRRYAIISA